MRLGTWLVLALLGWPAAAHALVATLPLAQAHHTAWRADSGAPANIVAMAQTADGFLWLGTGGGLYRFDGVRFEHLAAVGQHPSLSGSITALQAMPSGELLIGHRFGGVSILEPAGLQHHTAAQGLPTGNCWAFAVDGRGEVWGAFTGGLARLRQGAWQVFTLDGEAVPFRTMVVDAQGTLWATAKTGAYALAAGADAFERVEATLPSFPYLSLAPDGTVWAADFDRSRLVALAREGGRFAAATGREALAFPPSGDRHWFDAHGGLWVRAGGGVVRVARPGDGGLSSAGVRQATAEPFGVHEGLTGAFESLLEDREGNIWLGTAGGLDRLRQPKVLRVELGPQGGAVGVAPAEGAAVWATSEFDGLFHVGQTLRSLGPIGPRPSHLHRDRQGVLWVGSRTALWRVDGRGAATEVPRPDADDPRPGAEFAPVHAMGTDRSGALWAHLVVKGTFRRQDGRWTKVDDALAAPVMSMGNDAEGRLWLGYIDRGAARVDGDEILSFTPAEGLAIGTVMAIHGRGPRVWLGGQRGVALYERGVMRTLAFKGLETLRVVTGIVETASGELWLNAADGLTRIPADAWRRAVDDPTHAVPFERFDGHDGLLGAASQIRPLPSLIEAGDGRLWAALPSGLFVIDPARLPRNPLPPSVLVRAVVVDGARFEAGTVAQVPSGRADLRFDYTATSLSVPERVRFRYKLEGYDAQWQEAGARREAAYTRVGPGHYVFRVVAANDDGVWNEQGASLAVDVPPAFWQTWRFMAVALALAGLAVFALYRLRIRQVSRRLQERMQARLLERERIARELHDTLLQGVTGLMLHVQAAVNPLPAGSGLRGRLELALERAHQVLVEGRDRVVELRVPMRLRTALAAGLAEACRELTEAFAGPATCRLEVVGRERELKALVAEEVDRVAREAMANALRHAGATQVVVGLRFGRHALRLTVSDDGHGFDEAQPGVADRPGHFGLTGMRERAARIGARLRIESGSGGTVVRLDVPASTAYAAKASA